MAKQLVNVFRWPARLREDAPAIPPHLVLAILTRGRIDLPSEAAQWLLENSASGLRLKSMLSRHLLELLGKQAVAVTLELFLNRRPERSVREAGEVLNAYLRLRLKDAAPAAPLFIYWFDQLSGLSALEAGLDLDASRLLSSARVGRDDSGATGRRHILVAYVALPEVVRSYVRDESRPPDPPQGSPDGFPPLTGYTPTNTERMLRAAPGADAEAIADEDGDSVQVTLDNKERVGGDTWVHLTLQSSMRAKLPNQSIELTPGTQAWTIRAGVDPVFAPWDYTRAQLLRLERATGAGSRVTAITALRQLTHSSELDFDQIIGTPAGTHYLDTRPYEAERWELGKDYDGTIPPDGRAIDLQHLLVGLDVLARPERPATFTKFKAQFNIGTNWSATTWAGDIGAAVGDMQNSVDELWEQRNQGAPATERADHYFATRAADWDLLADIDAWMIQDPAVNGAPTAEAMIAHYYEDTVPGATRTTVRGRRRALTAFLLHHGFTYSASEKPNKEPALVAQSSAVQLLTTYIRIFGKIWLRKASGWNLLQQVALDDPQASIVDAMTRRFLLWLDALALEVGVETAAPLDP